MQKNKVIFVAGHRGMVGAAILRELKKRDYKNIITRTHTELDLEDQGQVKAFFESQRIDEVYMAAAKVGGIHANHTYPAEFIYQNLMVEANVIHQSWKTGVQKLLFLGSSCIYPRLAEQPIKEKYLLTGRLEPTNEAYAIAKIAGIKLCESYNRQYGTDYRSVMPTNLYGPGDHYHPTNSHVIPGLIRRFHEAKVVDARHVSVWGSGTPRREFLHVEDVADACVHVMELDRINYDAHTLPMGSHINIGTGEDVTIRELAEIIMNVVGFKGELMFDLSKPDGPPQKLLDVSLMGEMGWKANIDLIKGIKLAYEAFLVAEKK
ncbi:GDP-L-fucose synthase [Glaciimonas sp. CA11.2]|uniref:GDP-L-fucose synthase n=1 Tax=Glaciimonas sp. CA11.2 TaxID=3048601 RepID=UPI002AB4D55C|nr:GDP-L-fucose synthase [Glaciimonas sp. CA11.2]MDY7545659.1 GDP-L-fucose synthase [Glaciimonas sp. CA11.2]MEB0163388.1 GDP-L-fucose synthase [Glaciimonas sp. CA11.2]